MVLAVVNEANAVLYVQCEHGGYVVGAKVWQAEPGTVAGGTALPIADRVWAIDLGFQGWDHVVYAYLLAAPDELALIETGPTATLPALLRGIRAAGFDPGQVRKVLVSHIHLDHSGGAGALLREIPEAKVFVHPIGAPHLVDPSKLVSSAGRLYGDRMDDLWGDIVPVASDRVVPLTDGETLDAAGQVLSALFTPGHASHHVAYWAPELGAIFTGDVGGVRMPGSDYALPPAPLNQIFKAMFTDQGKFFYMAYFQQEGVAEAEFEADVRGALRRMCAQNT